MEPAQPQSQPVGQRAGKLREEIANATTDDDVSRIARHQRAIAEAGHQKDDDLLSRESSEYTAVSSDSTDVSHTPLRISASTTPTQTSPAQPSTPIATSPTRTPTRGEFREKVAYSSNSTPISTPRRHATSGEFDSSHESIPLASGRLKPESREFDPSSSSGSSADLSSQDDLLVQQLNQTLDSLSKEIMDQSRISLESQTKGYTMMPQEDLSDHSSIGQIHDDLSPTPELKGESDGQPLDDEENTKWKIEEMVKEREFQHQMTINRIGVAQVLKEGMDKMGSDLRAIGLKAEYVLSEMEARRLVFKEQQFRNQISLEESSMRITMDEASHTGLNQLIFKLESHVEMAEAQAKDDVLVQVQQQEAEVLLTLRGGICIKEELGRRQEILLEEMEMFTEYECAHDEMMFILETKWSLISEEEEFRHAMSLQQEEAREALLAVSAFLVVEEGARIRLSESELMEWQELHYHYRHSVLVKIMSNSVVQVWDRELYMRNSIISHEISERMVYSRMKHCLEQESDTRVLLNLHQADEWMDLMEFLALHA